MMKYMTTSFNPTGNRWIQECSEPLTGTVTRTIQQVSTIPVGDPSPVWAVGSSSLSTQFVVSYNDLTVERYGFDNATNQTYQLENSPDRPLLASLDSSDDTLVPFLSYPDQTSNYSAAVPLPDGGFLFVSKVMGVRQTRPNGNDVTSLSLAAMDDPHVQAQIIFSPTNELWSLYTGGADGCVDAVCKSKYLQIMHHDDAFNLMYSAIRIILDDGLVFSGLSPLFSDLDGDGVDDVLTTVVQSGRGASLRGYLLQRNATTSSGFSIKQEIRTSSAGQGDNVWVHPVAVGPLGPNGEQEIVEVRSPGGVVRFYSLSSSGEPTIAAELPSGYLIHDGEQPSNKDMVTVGDFDGDGIPEVVLQKDSDVLVGLQHTSCGVKVAWEVPLPSPLATNLAGSCNTETKSMNLLFGTSDHGLIRLEFAPTAENMAGLGAVAACLASDDGANDNQVPTGTDESTTSPADNGTDEAKDNDTTVQDASSAMTQSPYNVLWTCTLCILLVRWLMRR